MREIPSSVIETERAACDVEAGPGDSAFVDPAVRCWNRRVAGHYLTRVGSSAGGDRSVEQAGHLAPRVAATASLQ